MVNAPGPFVLPEAWHPELVAHDDCIMGLTSVTYDLETLQSIPLLPLSPLLLQAAIAIEPETAIMMMAFFISVI